MNTGACFPGGAGDGHLDLMAGSYSRGPRDSDGDMDFIGTRGNSAPYDGVFWLEQVRTDEPRPAFERARLQDSAEMALPD